MQISDTENDGTSPDISTDKAIAAGDTTAITLYAIWEKASEYKITYKLNKGKNNTANPKTYTSEDEIKFKKPTRSGYHFVGWYTDSKYKNQRVQKVPLLYMQNGQRKSVLRRKLHHWII